MDVVADNKTAKKFSALKKWVVFVLILFTLSLLIFRFVLIPGNVPSASMEPTLMTGDIIFVNGLAYDTHDPQRGDIIAFHSQELGWDIKYYLAHGVGLTLNEAPEFITKTNKEIKDRMTIVIEPRNIQTRLWS